jgi:hypothetical protein
VKEPAAPAVTVTEAPVVDPTNEAPEVLLVKDQLWLAIFEPEFV